MIARSESWRKKADSDAAASKLDFDRNVGFLQLREISICTAVP